MKKSHIIIIMIAILIIAAALYYFYFYPSEQLIIVQNGQNKIISDEITEPLGTEVKEKIDNNENDQEGVAQDEEVDENKDIMSGDGNTENAEIINNYPNSKANLSDDNNKNETEKIKLNKVKEADKNINYPYRNVFRNPFREYRIVETNNSDVFTIEAIKEMVPFELKGIIGNNFGRLAVIDYRNQSLIIREKTEIDEFWIIDILDEELLILYRGIQFKLEMGSDIGEGL